MEGIGSRGQYRHLWPLIYILKLDTARHDRPPLAALSKQKALAYLGASREAGLDGTELLDRDSLGAGLAFRGKGLAAELRLAGRLGLAAELVVEDEALGAFAALNADIITHDWVVAQVVARQGAGGGAVRPGAA